MHEFGVGAEDIIEQVTPSAGPRGVPLDVLPRLMCFIIYCSTVFQLLPASPLYNSLITSSCLARDISVNAKAYIQPQLGLQPHGILQDTNYFNEQ